MFHVKHPPKTSADFAAAVNASTEQMVDLETFQALLEDENRRLNLVGPSALAEFWSRHVYDSAQILGLRPNANTFADLGAGAGFPGLVLAILLKSASDAHVHLIESQSKRCRFLQKVIDQLALPATVHNRRAESFKPAPCVDIVTARACAPVARLFEYALPFTRAGATGLFLKGRSVETEIAVARSTWRFTAELLPSLSDPEGRILHVEALARA